MALTETMFDAFTGGTISGSRWSTFNSASQGSGVLTLSALSNSTAYSGVDSVSNFDLTGSYALIQLTNAGDQTIASFECYPLQLIKDSSNYVFWYVNNGTIAAKKKVAGVVSSISSATYSSTTHKWLKIRESGGTIFFDRSSDGRTWTNFTSLANPFVVTSLQTEISAGKFATVATATSMKVDNYNLGPVRYWVGGTGNYTNTSHWSNRSGGTSGAPAPDVTEDVYFDANSFSAGGQVVTVNNQVSARNFIWTGATNTPKLDINGWELDIYGDTVTFISAMTTGDTGGGGSIQIIPDVLTTCSITTNGLSITVDQIYFGSTAVSLQDNLTVVGDIQIVHGSSGSFNTNSHNITCTNFYADSASTVTLGTSIITVNGDVDTDSFGTAGNNLSAASATFVINSTSANYYYQSAVTTIGSVDFAGDIAITLNNATITNITLHPGKTYTLNIESAGVKDKLTFTNLIAVGSPSSKILLRSDVPGQQRKLNKTSGTVTVSNVDLQDSLAQGGATFNAVNSTNSGNNTGWSFVSGDQTGNIAVSGDSTTSVGGVSTQGGHIAVSGDSTSQATARLTVQSQELDRKYFTYKVYNSTGTYLGELNDVLTPFSYSQQVNTAGSAISIELNRSADTRIITGDTLGSEAGFSITTEGGVGIASYSESNQPYGPGTMIDFNNRVDVWAFFGYPDVLNTQSNATVDDQVGDAIDISIGSPNGRRVFTGFITDFTAQYGDSSTTKISLASYGAQLAQYVIEDTGSTEVPYYSKDPADILRSILDKASALSLKPTYDSASIVNTNTVVTYQYKLNTMLEGVNKVLQLSPSDWYWYYDQGTNKVWLRGTPNSPTHTFYLGKHFKSMQLTKQTDTLVNTVYFKGGDTNADTAVTSILFKKYTDAASIALYGQHLKILTDERVTLEDTADILAGSELDQNANPRYTTEIVILDKTYPIEDIRLGDLVAFRNFNNFIDTVQLQILGLTYNADYITLQLGSLLPSISKRIVDIKRNLEDVQTLNAPATPTT